MDLKYDIMKHPDVRMTADGKTEAYVHGEPWDAGPSIELVFDPELIKEASENAHVIDLGDSDYVLLSEEEVAQEIKEQNKKKTNY